MQSLEAIISLMVLVSILSYMLGGIGEKAPLDDSLYRYRLAGDVWRTAYLKGHFKDLDTTKNHPTRDALQQTFENITDKTDLCIYFGGKLVSSCPQEKMTQKLVTINRVAYDKGEARNITLSLGLPESR
jgi:hypothetical protein